MQTTPKAQIIFKSLVLVSSLLITIYWIVNTFSDEEYSEAAYEFEQIYGSSLDDFYYIGEEFQGRWLTEVEDKNEPCVINKHCVHIKIASVAHCEKGSVLEFSVLDSNSKVLGTHESEVFMVKKGEIIQLELGSTLLTEKGFIEPLDAYCKDLLPEV